MPLHVATRYPTTLGSRYQQIAAGTGGSSGFHAVPRRYPLPGYIG
ncbi:hypothetical protein [Gluconobacter vitians]|nr:hypothetical protein [Gluconobacter vitians]